MQRRPTDHVNLPVDGRRDRGATFRRHRCQYLPTIINRVILPGMVDRHPGRWPGFGRNEPAERIELSIELREGDMMSRQGHRLFLSPLVHLLVVLIHEALRDPTRTKSAENIKLAATRSTDKFLRG